MFCLSVFQAALSIRESAALAVNLRGASWLPAPRQAAVCTAARPPPLLPAGRDARPGSDISGKPASPALQDVAKLRPEGARASSPLCGSSGDSPCTSQLPCSRDVVAVVCTRRAPRGPHQHRGSAVPRAPASHPGRPPGQRLDGDPAALPCGMGPAEIPHGRWGQSWHRVGDGDKPCLGSAARWQRSSSTHGAGGSGGKMDLPRGEWAPRGARRARRLGSGAALLVRH